MSVGGKSCGSWRRCSCCRLSRAARKTLVGGQAVLEGVMMRSPHAWGIAVRKRQANCHPQRTAGAPFRTA